MRFAVTTQDRLNDLVFNPRAYISHHLSKHIINQPYRALCNMLSFSKTLAFARFTTAVLERTAKMIDCVVLNLNEMDDDC